MREGKATNTVWSRISYNVVANNKGAFAAVDECEDPRSKTEREIKMQAPEMPDSTKRRRLQYRVDEERRLREFSEIELESQLKKVISLEGFLAVIHDENSRLSSSLAEERRLREYSESALENQGNKVISLECQLEAALKAVHQKIQQIECMRKYLEGDSKKRDRESDLPFVASFQTDTKKLVAERDDLKQKVDSVLSSLAGGRASFWNEVTSERMEEHNVGDKLAMAEVGISAAGLALAHQKAQAMKGDTDLAIALKEKEKVEKKLVSVEGERDAALLVLAQQKAEVIKCDTDLATIVIEERNLERKLTLVEDEKAQMLQECDNDLKMVVGERDAALLALAQQQAEVIKCDTDLADVLIEKRVLERKLILVEDEKAQMLKECDDEVKLLVQAHTEEVEMAIRDMVELKMTVESLREENSRLDAAHKANKRKLEEEGEKHLCQLDSLREEKCRLDVSHKAIQRNLEEEIEKRLCQICMESPKDTISFPCLHLNYCFSCLEEHRNRNNTCPTCRTTISGKLKLNICT